MKKIRLNTNIKLPTGALNRYRVVAALIVLALAAIFLKTTGIQYAGRDQDPVSFSRGQGRQMTIQAPRGLIVDRSGKTLAYSEQKDQLLLAYAGLDDFNLNRQLLDLALTMEAHGVGLPTSLEKYFDLSSKSKEGGGEDDLAFVFKKDLDEVAAWQQNKDLFNLYPETAKVHPRYKIKLDPGQFYDYLVYDLFHIEDRYARGNVYYSQAEAWKILRLRYELYVNNWTFLQVIFRKYLYYPATQDGLRKNPSPTRGIDEVPYGNLGFPGNPFS